MSIAATKTSYEQILMLLENEPYPGDTRVRREAESLVRAGHAVTVIAPRQGEQPGREEIAGVSVVRYDLVQSNGTARGYVAEYATAHLRLLVETLRGIRRGATVVHVHNPPDSLVVCAFVARALRRKVVFDNHDLFPELLETKFGRSPLVAALRVLQRAMLCTAHVVIATNESQRELLRSQLPDALKAVYVVRNGPPAADIDAPAPLRSGPLTDPTLLFVGALESQDGVVALAEILREVRQRPAAPDAHLVVVGDGVARGDLARRIEELGLGAHCTLVGRVPHEQVAGFLTDADVCVDPAPCNTFNNRSSMIKVVEYLAAGRPVVTYDLLETRRTAPDAVLFARCGDRADFVDKIALLARDGRLRAELAGRARERAEALVWEHSERVLLDLYARLREP